MKHKIENTEKYVILKIQENKLDSSISMKLKPIIISVLNQSNNIILDMEQVKYTDSSGLSSLLVGNKLVQEKNGIFVLVKLSDHTNKLIKISQLDSILNILPTLEEGIDAVFMHEIESELNDEE